MPTNPENQFLSNIMQSRSAKKFQCIGLFLLLAGLSVTACAKSPSEIKLPFEESFPSTNLGSAWTQEISDDGKIFVQDNWITFESALPQQCHIARPAEVDNITISAKVVRWSGIYLVWDAQNWCGVGKVSPTPFGRFYSIDVANGKTNEVDHRGTDFHAPHTIRAQLGRDHVRFQYLLGNDWIELRTIERPKEFSGAPKWIRIGKYYGSEDTPYGAKDSSVKTSGAIREHSFFKRDSDSLSRDGSWPPAAEAPRHLDGPDGRRRKRWSATSGGGVRGKRMGYARWEVCARAGSFHASLPLMRPEVPRHLGAQAG